MTAPIPLRAHMVLCLIGFRGSGYSPGFVGAMRKLQENLLDDPSLPVQLVNEPDGLCAVCPHGGESGCQLQGEHHEAHMRAHDGAVLHRLGLEAGAVEPWAAILERLRQRIKGSDLPQICTTCPWLPLGVCAESLDGLREPDPPLWEPDRVPGSPVDGG
jgi:hypothetical protein